MLEYALLTAGNRLAMAGTNIRELARSVEPLEAVLFVAALWVVWRIVAGLIGPRHG